MNIVLAHEVDWDGFRVAARRCAMAGTAPEDVSWSVEMPDDLFAGDPPPDPAPGAPPPSPGTFTLPRALVELAQTVIQAREPHRFGWLYALIRRAHGGERTVLAQTTDPMVHRVQRLAQAVRRDTHKMRAFLRFREVTEAGETRHVAWFEPSHFIVEANAPFFIRRFTTTSWSILTPYRSAHWNGAALTFGPGAAPADVPDDDRLETYWRATFSGLFRQELAATTAQRPKKYWRNLPEAATIPEPMAKQPVLMPPRSTARRRPGPDRGDLERLAMEAADCRRCPLWQPATQTVFGEGPIDAAIMFVGEQPGDQEDLAGRPFVGPAGQVFDRALAEIGLDRTTVYVTNAVKHFKFEPRGKRRIHAKPEPPEIVACLPWLEQERALVKPRVTVLMGATAARAMLGRAVGITRERGRPITLPGGTGVITVHPSYLLRLPDEAAKQREYVAFVADLRLAVSLLAA